MNPSLITASLGLLLSVFPIISTAADFRVEGKAFMLDGKPFQIRSGELHYPRIPREEWANRIKMAKAMGLNTISTYVFWSLHEQKRGEYDFSGDKDVVAFIKLCQAEGMQVIIRPGPYVCAEWDLGGLPAWLLAEPGVKLRSTDRRFLEPAVAWMKHMGELVQPLSVAAGGPVLMVQIENEAGFLNRDNQDYLKALEKGVRAGGYSGTVFTADPPHFMKGNRGALPGVLQAVNFGGDAEMAFAKLHSFVPDQPDFTIEYWVGWFDTWGRPHQTSRPGEKVGDVELMMRTGASFNLYMFHGGTTRDLWTGSKDGKVMRPITDSHDWVSPLDESGRPTAKYADFRWEIQRGLKGETLPAIPSQRATGKIGTIALTEQCELLAGVPQGIKTDVPQSFEAMGQSQGMVLYRTSVQGPLEGTLDLGAVKDRVYVLLDGKVLGTSGRITQNPGVQVKVPGGTHRLDLLVENLGRADFGNGLDKERRGLMGPLELAGQPLGPFEQTGLSFQEAPGGEFQALRHDEPVTGPTLYRGKIQVDEPKDTWLDMRGFGRGMVWWNGRNLGRYWEIGPSQTIFLPACWIKTVGDNDLVVLEMDAESCPVEIKTSAKPIWETKGAGNLQSEQPPTTFPAATMGK